MKIEPAPDFALTFNEPQPDWVPINRALYYFSSSKFSASEEECANSLFVALEEITDSSPLNGMRVWPSDDPPIGIKAKYLCDRSRWKQRRV